MTRVQPLEPAAGFRRCAARRARTKLAVQLPPQRDHEGNDDDDQQQCQKQAYPAAGQHLQSQTAPYQSVHHVLVLYMLWAGSELGARVTDSALGWRLASVRQDALRLDRPAHDIGLIAVCAPGKFRAVLRAH